MSALLLCLLLAAGLSLLVAWPLRPAARIGTVAAITAASGILYVLLGSGFVLPRIAASEELNAATRAQLQRHMQEVATRPDQPATWISFGRDLMLAGRYAQSAEAYQQAYARTHDPHLLFDILTARYLAGDAKLGDDAAPWLEQAQAALPEAPATVYFTALRQAALGRSDKAAAMLDTLRPTVADGDPLAVLIDGERRRLASRIAP